MKLQSWESALSGAEEEPGKDTVASLVRGRRLKEVVLKSLDWEYISGRDILHYQGVVSDGHGIYDPGTWG